MKVYGPYTRKDGRQHVVLFDAKQNIRRTISYPRYLMEQYLGRTLAEEETVDHIDGNPLNNDFKNLRILSREENARIAVVPAETASYICPVCGMTFIKKKAVVRHNQETKKKAGPFCSRSCAGKYGQQVQVGEWRKW